MAALSVRRAFILGFTAFVLASFIAIGMGSGSDDQKSPSSPPDDQAGSHVTVRTPPIHVAPVQMDVNLVVVNVTVTDPFDRIVTGLDEDNFQVYDEKVEQKIVAFSTEDAPISVGLIFDCSGSMGDKIQKSKEAALQFFKTSNPQDEFMLVSFSDRPDMVSGFTAKFENLQDRLLTVKSGGRTALLDAIYLGLSEMKKATTNRRALLVISDGGDNHSRYTENDIKKAVKESDVQITPSEFLNRWHRAIEPRKKPVVRECSRSSRKSRAEGCSASITPTSYRTSPKKFRLNCVTNMCSGTNRPI
jgi:Mg-chelatase subunit ChlD